MKSFPDLVTAMPVSLLGDLDLQRVLSDFDIAAIAATFGSVSAVMKPFCDDLLKGKLAFFTQLGLWGHAQHGQVKGTFGLGADLHHRWATVHLSSVRPWQTPHLNR